MGTVMLHPPAVPELHPTRADAWGPLLLHQPHLKLSFVLRLA